MTATVGSPSVSSSAEVGRAYDRIAADYDSAVYEDLWLRRHLWRRYERLFPPGSHVLELACGTGLDTLFLLSNGARVTAVDVSEAMTDQLRRKLEGHPSADRANVLTMDMTDLEHLRSAGPFDGVLSAFAGLNTVEDLSAFAVNLATLLKPGAPGLLHLLAPASLWRCGRYWRRAGPAAAGLERRRRSRRAVIEGIAIEHRVQDLEEVRRQLEAGLRVTRSRALGVLWPRSWGRWISPWNLPWPSELDALAGRIGPLKNWGRFQVFEVQRPWE